MAKSCEDGEWVDLFEVLRPRERVFFETGLACLFCRGRGVHEGSSCLACRGRGRGLDRIVRERIPKLSVEEEREAIEKLCELLKDERFVDLLADLGVKP